jgi:hypothetical protein
VVCDGLACGLDIEHNSFNAIVIVMVTNLYYLHLSMELKQCDIKNNAIKNVIFIWPILIELNTTTMVNLSTKQQEII